MRSKQHIEFASHILFWLLFVWVLNKITVLEFVSEILIYKEEGVDTIREVKEDVGPLAFILIGLAIKLIVFYTIILFVFPRFFLKGQNGRFLMFSLGLLLMGILTEIFLDRAFISYVVHFDEVHLDAWMPANLSHYLILTAFTGAYLFFKQYYISERSREALEKAQLSTSLNS